MIGGVSATDTIPLRAPFDPMGNMLRRESLAASALAQPETGDVFYMGEDYYLRHDDGQFFEFKDGKTLHALLKGGVHIPAPAAWRNVMQGRKTFRDVSMEIDPYDKAIYPVIVDTDGYVYPMFMDDYHAMGNLFYKDKQQSIAMWVSGVWQYVQRGDVFGMRLTNLIVRRRYKGPVGNTMS